MLYLISKKWLFFCQVFNYTSNTSNLNIYKIVESVFKVLQVLRGIINNHTIRLMKTNTSFF